MRCVCVTKHATNTVAGNSRCSPHASDQLRKMSNRNGNSPAAGFHTSCIASVGSDWHINAIPIAVANIRTSPPLRRASATLATIASVLTAPIVTAMLVTLPKRAGSASSQYSIGPGLCMICP